MQMPATSPDRFTKRSIVLRCATRKENTVNIKQSAETFIKNLGTDAESEYTKVVHAFVTFVEGQQSAETAAVTLLEAAGYTVTAPAAVEAAKVA